MKTSTHLTALALLASCAASTQAAVYFQEDFNNKVTQELTDAGWQFAKNEFAKETGTDFGVANSPFDAFNFPSGKLPGADFTDPNSGLKIYGPPDANGINTAPGDQEGAGFLFSDSDAAGGSDDIGSRSEFYAITAPFSTKGGGRPWFHADTAYLANNNGECVADFSVSVDGGGTWIPFYQSAEPQRAIKGYRRSAGPEPEYNGAEVLGGTWPVLGSGSLTKSWLGLHGRVHFQLPEEAANKDDVRIRVRYFEPADAWWIGLDNIVVDDSPAPAGNTVVLSENFEQGIPSSWTRASATVGGWSTEPAKDADGNFYRFFTYKDEEQNDIKQFVNIDLIREAQSRIANGTNITVEALLKLDNAAFTEFPDLVNTNPNEGKLDGRFLMMLAGQGYALRSDTTDTGAIDDLTTPTLNLSDASNVVLAFDSESLPYSGSTFYEVHASVDNGQSWERVFTYMGAILDLGEAASFTRHHIPIPQAAGKAQVAFRFHARGGDSQSRGFWAIDNVNISADKSVATPIQLTASKAANGRVNISWTGGQGPFTLQKKSTLTGTWANVVTTGDRSALVEAAGGAGYYRVVEGAAP